MKKLNVVDVAANHWVSPKGHFDSFFQCLSEALGRDPTSTDLMKRHPFDVEICRLPAGKHLCPYHSHSAQWEFYYILSGRGKVRHAEGVAEVQAGDFFLFPPEEPHQLTGGDNEELVYLIVADNPIGEHCYYPDSNKWSVRIPERRLIRSAGLDYFDGEE